ncbi:MAG: resuscitation-promoting factor RpfA [Actinomycetota bacterium]|jgi:hypothetical protein
MPPIPVVLPARARARRLVATAGILALTFGLVQAGGAQAADAGRAYPYGQAADKGSPSVALAGIAVTPSGGGYWTATPSGRVDAFGDAPRLGGTNVAGVVDIARTPTGRGYFLALADGGVLAFGDARFIGSMGGKRLAAPIVGMSTTPTGLGYWLVASDGGIFAFGDARYMGSMGGTKLVAPVTAIASTPTGRGYWMAAEDGGVFSFGDATYRGSMSEGGITSMAAAPKGLGYWLVTGSGVVRGFGSAASLGNLATGATVIDVAPRPQNDGYWLVTGEERATYSAAAAPATAEPTDADWDRIAQCESSGNWGARGNGYEGGLQFLNSTWLNYGGGQFAQHAYDSPRAGQIAVARNVWRDQGWSAWPSCSRQLGYR